MGYTHRIAILEGRHVRELSLSPIVDWRELRRKINRDYLRRHRKNEATR